MSDLQTVSQRMTISLHDYHQYQGQSNDCGPTSLAIAANALLDAERYLKDKVAEDMNDPGFQVWPFPHFVVRRIRNWATFPWGLVHDAREHRFHARWRPFGTLARLQRNLDQDRVTLVFVGEPLRWKEGGYDGWAHVKVLFGYTPGKGWAFVDPGHSKGGDPDSWSALGIFWQDADDFLSAWRGLFRIYVEVWLGDG